MSACLTMMRPADDAAEALAREQQRRRQAEQALRDVRAELARVARVTAMGEFAASIAHEVAQPLSAIVLTASAALAWLEQQPPDLERLREGLRSILSASSRSAEMVRTIRAMARKAGPELAPFAVDQAICEVLLLMGAELQKHGIELRLQLDLGERLLCADRSQLQQVVMNLVLNAIDAIGSTGSGHGVLELCSQLAGDGGAVHISVADNGCGIAAGSAGRLFDPLFSTKPDGMGLGLSICRSIVEAHGGRLWHEPRQPQGSTFHLVLPTGKL